MSSPRTTLATNQPAQESQRQVPPLAGALQRGLLRSRGFIGRHLSVRWKLTLWYGAMCSVALAAAGWAMSASLQQQVQGSIDSNLRGTASRVATGLAQSTAKQQALYETLGAVAAFPNYAHNVQQALNKYSYQSSAPGVFEQVLLAPPAGSPFGQSCLLQPFAKKLCQQSYKGVLLDPLTLAASAAAPQLIDVEPGPLRAYVTSLAVPPYLQKHSVAGFLEVYQQERNYFDILGRLNLILKIGIVVMLLLALIVGWWIAKAALRPINRISRTVAGIGESKDLSRRLDFVGPSDEVGRLAATFDSMMDRLENTFNTQKRFVADASHELRTPLTAIRGNADLLSIAPPEERDICVAAIRRESERMSRLVTDLLLLAAADAEEQPVHLTTVALDDVLSDVYRSALVLADDRLYVDNQLITPVTTQADPDRIKQLLLNLIDNAIKFTPPDGTVTLRLDLRGSEALIQVADTGLGIPSAQQASIFERFYRVEEARSTRGSGLGLSICAWIAAAHGGRITVESRPGEGSTFSVYLPHAVARPSTRHLTTHTS